MALDGSDTPKTECIDQAFAERGAKARFRLDGIQDRRIGNLGGLGGRAPQPERDQNLMHDRNPERKGGIKQDTDPAPITSWPGIWLGTI